MTAQSGSITGSVTDSNSNEPLPGVNVVVQNTSNGTNTDFNGNFSLDNVNSGDVLVFSYLGFKTLEYTVSDSFNLSISLEKSFSLSVIFLFSKKIERLTKFLPKLIFG